MGLGKKIRWLALGLLLLGVARPPSAFAQATDQQAAARKVKKRVDPTYPPLAKQYHLAGRVRVEVSVSADGSVVKSRLVGGSPLLAGAALEAVRQWKYEPGKQETTEIIDFDFHAE